MVAPEANVVPRRLRRGIVHSNNLRLALDAGNVFFIDHGQLFVHELDMGQVVLAMFQGEWQVKASSKGLYCAN